VPAVRAFALWSIPSALVLLSMSGYYGYMGNYTYMWALGIASFLQPLWHTGMLYVPYLQGKRDFRASTIYQMIEALSVAALSVAAALYAANILLLVGIFLGGHALFATVWLYKNMCAESRVKNKKHVREMLRYAKHLSGMKVWSSGIQHIDKIIVFQLLGPTALATYAIALAIPAQIRTLLQNTSRLVLPKFSKHPSIAHTTRTFIHKIPHVTFLLLLITTVYTLIASPLYTILFPTYPDAILLSQIYAISFLALPNILFGRTLAAHACVRHMYIQNIATGIITILCITIGGITFDIIGIISGRVLAFFILGTLSVTLTKHAVKQSATHQNQNV